MRCCLILIIFFMNWGGLKAVAPSPFRIAAVVNNGIISQADVMNRLRFAMLSSGVEPSAENLEKMKSQILRIMIDELLQLQTGQLYGIEIEDQHVQAAIQDIESNNGLQPGSIYKMMEANGIPFKIFEDQIKAQLVWLIYIREKYPLKTLEDQLSNKRHQPFTPSLQIADWEIAEEIKSRKKMEKEKLYHLAEISLPFDNTTQEAKVQNTLQQLLEELQKGAPFSALAQQFSQSATASQGGDMGWLMEDQMEPEIREAITYMQPGQLSAPIRTAQGYVLIAFIEQKLPQSEDNVVVTMQQALFPFAQGASEEQVREIVQTAAEVGRSAKSCTVLPNIAKEKFPLADSHLTQDEPLSAFPDALQKIILSLDVNQASEPLLTEQGALVIMVCDKKSQKAEEFSREDAIELIAGRKHALLARRELRDLRRQSFIDIRM